MTQFTSKELPAHLAAIAPRGGFSDVNIFVIGDFMLDRYVIGEVNRISPEAPVPVLSVREERATAGGAGNVALTIAGLRAKTTAVGVIGNDAAGETLLNILSRVAMVVKSK